jgi:hypothetical protein
MLLVLKRFVESDDIRVIEFFQDENLVDETFRVFDQDLWYDFDCSLGMRRVDHFGLVDDPIGTSA